MAGATGFRVDGDHAVSVSNVCAGAPVRSVVIVTPWFPNAPGDWFAQFILRSAASVRRLGSNVSVLVYRPYVPRSLDRWAPRGTAGRVDGAAFASQIDRVVTVRYPSFPGNLMRPVSNFVSDRRVIPAICKLARETGASLIHAQTEGAAPMSVQAGRSLGIPVAATIHGLNTNDRYLHSSGQRRRLAGALSELDRLILVGEPLRSTFETYAGHGDHIRIVANGVSLPTAARTRAVFASPPLRFVSVANLQEGKGLEIALEALSRLDQEGVRDWSFEVIGDGPGRASLREQSMRLQLEGRVAFVGAKPQDYVFRRLLDSDVFVLPSYREAFGIAYLEAMACGLPVIGVKGQGPAAFIENGVSGFLVAPNDAGAVADCLQSIVADPDQARAVGARAAQVAKNFGWESHAARLMGVYSEMLAARPS